MLRRDRVGFAGSRRQARMSAYAPSWLVSPAKGGATRFTKKNGKLIHGSPKGEHSKFPSTNSFSLLVTVRRPLSTTVGCQRIKRPDGRPSGRIERISISLVTLCDNGFTVNGQGVRCQRQNMKPCKSCIAFVVMRMTPEFLRGLLLLGQGFNPSGQAPAPTS